jgi:hypothetical protein
MGTPHVMCMSKLPSAHEGAAGHAAAERVTTTAVHGSCEQSDEKPSDRQSK